MNCKNKMACLLFDLFGWLVGLKTDLFRFRSFPYRFQMTVAQNSRSEIKKNERKTALYCCIASVPGLRSIRTRSMMIGGLYVVNYFVSLTFFVVSTALSFFSNYPHEHSKTKYALIVDALFPCVLSFK